MIITGGRNDMHAESEILHETLISRRPRVDWTDCFSVNKGCMRRSIWTKKTGESRRSQVRPASCLTPTFLISHCSAKMWRAICVILLGSFFDYTCAAVHYDNWAWDESPHDLPNGSFLYPRQHPITFLQFSLVNISWNTTYEYTDISCYQLETSWYFPLKSGTA